MPIVTTSNTSSRRPHGKSPVTLLIAAVVVIAAVAIYLGARAARPRNPRQVPDTTDKPSPSMDSPKADSKAEPASPASAADAAPASPRKARPNPAAEGGQTSSSDAEDATAATAAAAAKHAAWEAAESNRLAKSEALILAREPKTHFDNEVENVLERVSKQGALFMQVPQIDMSQEQVLEFLRRPVEIYDDDDQEAVAAKERVAEFKTAALKFIEEGGTINQFVRDCAAANKEAHDTLEEIKREKRRIMLEQGEEAAQAYLDEVNPQLKEAGLPEVKIGRGDYNALRNKTAAEGAAKGGDASADRR